MAFLDKSNFDMNREYLMTGDTRPAPSMDQSQNLQDAAKSPTTTEFGAMTTGAGSLGGTSVAPSMDLQTTSAPQVKSTVEEKKPDGTIKTTTTDTQPVFKTTGSLMQRLQDPITQGAQQGQQRLQEASNVFQQMAGPSRTFEGIGGAGTLNRAVESGTGMDEARALTSAQYGGPAGLDVGEVADLQGLQQEMAGRAQALGTGGGLSTLIQQSVPGLSTGEARFEAKRRLEGSKVAGRDLRFEQVNPFGQSIVDQERTAREFASQRGMEEDLIRESSRGLVTGRKDVIDTSLERIMNEARAQQAGGQEAYENILGADLGKGKIDALMGGAEFLQSGTREDPGTLEGKEVAEKFSSPGYLQTIEGRELMEGILGDPRYSSIKDYDPLGLTVTKRGKQFYGTKDEEGDVTDLRATESDASKRALLYKRQKELEGQFGAKGDFNTTNPLYFGSEFKAADPTQYLGFDPGTSPSRENLSSDVQREQFNRITDLLGSLDKIGESQPFRAAKIFAEAERYLDEEQANLDSIKGDLTKEQKEWGGMVHRARKKYKKKKRKAEYAKIGAAVGTGVGTVLGALTLPIGGPGFASIPALAGAGASVGGSLA